MRLFATRLTAIAATLRRAWSPTSLFASGEQGAWYDPSDLLTMYQDAAGTTPVYMPGQGQVDPPVGLLLDKRLGLVRGPERLTNGSFSAGAAGWNVIGADATHIATFADGKVRYQSDTTSPVLALSQAAAGLVPDSYYEILITLSSWVSGSLKTDSLQPIGTAGGLQFTFSGVGTYRFVGKAVASNFGILRAVTNVDLTIDSISIKELSGNHAYQTTTTSRPTLSGRYNLLVSSENLASGWSLFNGAVTQAGDYWKFTENTTANLHSFLQTPSQPKAALYRATFTGKPAGRSIVRFVLNAYSGNFAEVRFDLAAGTVVGVFTGGDGVVSSYSIAPAGDGGYSCTIVGRPSAAASGTAFDVSLGLMEGGSASYAGDGVSGILVNKFDCRSANDGVGLPPYQRVVDPNTYDTVGFPLYLRFDGVDDFLQTAAVDFSGVTAVLVMAAARKLSDASRGIVVELGATGYGQPGSINIEQAWFSANWASSYSGATGSATVTEPGIGAPVSAVVGSYANQLAPSIQLRYQGNARASSTAAVGGGGFLNAPLYIGRRGGSSSPANMRLYSLVIRGAATPDDTIDTVERHLNSKARIY